MVIKYDFNKEDYLNFNMDYLMKSGLVKRFFYIQKIFLAIVLFVVLYFFQVEYNVSKIHLGIFYLVFFFAWSVLEGFMIKFLVKKKLLSDLKKDTNIIGEKVLEFKDDGIHDTTNKSDYLIKWKYVKFIDDMDNYIFIFTTLNSGYIIPKKYIEDSKLIVKFVNENIEKIQEKGE